MSVIDQFRFKISEEVIADLRSRLRGTRWTDQLENAAWSYGTEKGFLQKLCNHWCESYDWRLAEARFNAFPQYETEIDGEHVHFYHVRSSQPNAIPLIITHGYPGSIAEFLEIFGPLSDPARHGGKSSDAFHVVAPSIPGYGFSGPTRNGGFSLEKAAQINLRLMTFLGYDRFVAQGGDWGSGISTAMAVREPERLIALHLNFIIGFPEDPANPLAGLNEEERRQIVWKAGYDEQETGYRAIQSTKPQSLAYALNDSPAGLAAWIVEKFRTWSDCDDIETAFTMDQMLDNITLYWITGTINSAMRLYYESLGSGRLPSFGQVSVPTGYAHFPAEIRPTPRLWAQQIYTNIVRWTEMPKGGHFAALEQPTAFVDELRSFVRMFRCG